MALFRLVAVSKYAKAVSTLMPRRNYHSKLSTNQLDSTGKSAVSGFEDKVAIITGGASGIGATIARKLLKQGLSSLAIVDNDNVKAREYVEKLSKEYGDERILFTQADVGNSKEMDIAFRNTMLHFDNIDIIINNAGIMDDTQWEAEIKTNLHGCVIGTLLGMQYMAKSNSGSGGTIINIGSVMSVFPSSGFPIYSMTQFGIAGFSKALGSSNLYERTGVRIFAFCPGLTNTTLIKNASKNTINDNFGLEYQEEIENCVVQSTDSVVQGLINIFEVATPGSLWIAENNREPYEVNNFDAAAIKKFIDRGVKENSKKQ